MTILVKYMKYVKYRSGMRVVNILLLTNIVLMNTSYAQEEVLSDPKFPLLEGTYMGQKPPGMLAEPFAPGIISREGWEGQGVFAPGMKEFYFVRDLGAYTSYDPDNFQPTVIGFRQENNVWKKYIDFPRQGEIAFSPDGQRMHMSGGYMDRLGEGWSERKSLGPMFENEELGIMRLSVSTKGTYVFDDFKSKVGIRISTIEDGKRQAPIVMDSIINRGELTAHPFIAPDESYLIWDCVREGGYGASDLYISFRQKDSSWGSAINLGDKINSEKGEGYGSVTSDGRYLLFGRRIDNKGDNIDIYWVDAQVIENLRLKP